MKIVTTLLLILSCYCLKANDISLLTYNVNYSFINDEVVSILDSLNVDVICLQETNAKWEGIIKNKLKDKYPYIQFKHCCTAGGLAILSKYPIIKSTYIENKTGWFPAWVVTVKKNLDTVQLLNVHLKPGLTKRGRIGWNAYFKADDIRIKELTQFIKNLDENLPTIILGDFNANDKGKTMKWLTKEKGYQDALSKFDKRSKTWRWIILRGRYDHMVFNNQLSCSLAAVYQLGKSDHLPVRSEFVFKNKKARL